MTLVTAFPVPSISEEVVKSIVMVKFSSHSTKLSAVADKFAQSLSPLTDSGKYVRGNEEKIEKSLDFAKKKSIKIIIIIIFVMFVTCAL